MDSISNSAVFCLLLLWLPLGADIVNLVLAQVKSDQVIQICFSANPNVILCREIDYMYC